MKLSLNYSIKEYIYKFFWILAPLAWGSIIYFFVHGPFQIDSRIRFLLGIIVISLYCRKSLQNSENHNQIHFFKYPVYIPSWKILVTLSCIMITMHLLFFTWDIYPACDSLMQGVFACAIFEELLARMIFILYPLQPLEFIIFNIMNSLSFSFMHAGYYGFSISLYELIFKHFEYSFMLGIIAYKSQRIELSILMHMTSNFFRYTLPVLILNRPIPFINLGLYCLELLLVASITHKASIKK